MHRKFIQFYRGFLLFLLLTLAWSLWAGAQTATNKPPTTNQPSRLVQEFEQLDQRYVTFGLDRIAPLNDHTFLGEPLWKYVASLIYIVLALVASKLVHVITHVWLKKITARTGIRFADALLDLLSGPIKVVVLVVLLAIGVNIFQWAEPLRSYLSKALILVVAASLTYLAVKLMNLLLDVWKARTAHEADRKFNDQLFSIIRKSLDVFIVIVAVLVTAQNMGVNITAAITSLSIGGLAVGLAAQDTLANLFGAVAVFADKPFRVGDQIKLDGAEGLVESVGMRSTRVRNPEGNLVSVPNKTMGNAIITNLTSRPSIKTVMNLTLSQSLPMEKVKRALALLDEIYRHNPMTEDVWVSFNQFTGGNLNVMVTHWWKGTDYQKYLAGMQEMNLAVKERFDAEGIKFA